MASRKSPKWSGGTCSRTKTYDMNTYSSEPQAEREQGELLEQANQEGEPGLEWECDPKHVRGLLMDNGTDGCKGTGASAAKNKDPRGRRRENFVPPMGRRVRGRG